MQTQSQVLLVVGKWTGLCPFRFGQCASWVQVIVVLPATSNRTTLFRQHPFTKLEIAKGNRRTFRQEPSVTFSGSTCWLMENTVVLTRERSCMEHPSDCKWRGITIQWGPCDLAHALRGHPLLTNLQDHHRHQHDYRYRFGFGNQ